MIANINYVKEVMGELKAKKKFGQNFLIDSNVVDKIAKNACDENLTTIEIGPGLGALTEMLLKYSKNVDAYEIDKDMYELLLGKLKDDRLNVVLSDFLDIDLSKYKEKVNICANLPYYVTTPILFKIFLNLMRSFALINIPVIHSWFTTCGPILNKENPELEIKEVYGGFTIYRRYSYEECRGTSRTGP